MRIETMGIVAEKFGLTCVDEEEGLFHLPIEPGNDNEATLNKMSELESNGFRYQGIQNIVGQDAVMIFSCE